MINKLLPIFVGFLLWVSQIKADNHPIGASSSGMANASVTVSDLWSIYHNQAGLTGLNRLTFGAHFENAYFLKELSLKAFAMAIPTRSGTFGASYSFFGYSNYNESKFALSYAKKLAKSLSVGIQLDYFSTYIAENYGRKGIPAGEIGLLAEPIPNLLIGAHVFNVWQSKLSDFQDEKLPTIFRVGLGYKFSNKVIFTIETEKDLTQNPIFKAGIEYQIVDNLYLRTGIQYKPVLNTFGIGYNFSGIHFDLAFSKHDVLGYSSQISVFYTLGAKK